MDPEDLMRAIEIMLPPMKAVPDSFEGRERYIDDPMTNLIKQISSYRLSDLHGGYTAPIRTAFLDWETASFYTRTVSGTSASNNDAVVTAADKARNTFKDSYSKIRKDTAQAAKNIKELIIIAQAILAKLQNYRRQRLKPSSIGRWVCSKRSKPFSSEYLTRTRRWETEEAALAADKDLLDAVLESVSQANEACRVEEERQAKLALQASV